MTRAFDTTARKAAESGIRSVPGLLQRKLEVGASDDPLELDADRVADQVMASSSSPGQRIAAPVVGRSSDRSNAPFESAPASVESTLASSGQPLDPGLRTSFEQRFGRDLSQVRVHTDPIAAQSARDVHARAYTVGRHMVFGAQRFAPSTREGQRLIAHELAHVVQQSGSASVSGDGHANATLQREPEPDLEPYRIHGDKYSKRQKEEAATRPEGLILTSSVIGKFENKLSGGAPWPIVVGKDWMRFEGGRLGAFVSDYNDFTEYLGEVLRGIGRLQDLLGAGAPAFPTELTAAQKRALRPTDDTQSSVVKKDAFRDWRAAQASYADEYVENPATAMASGGLVFDVAQSGRDFQHARQTFWEEKGNLLRTLETERNLGKPEYEGLELKLSDAFSLVDPLAAAGMLVDKLQDAHKAREEYDAKMKIFGDAVRSASAAVKDQYEAFKVAEAKYWTALARYGKLSQDRDKARVESRRRAALLGQSTADPSEKRDPVLAQLRMPELVADAWHVLAVVGPAARRMLRRALGGQGVVERASHIDLSWRGHDPLQLNDITVMRRAWGTALTWKEVLDKQEIEDWVATDASWKEFFDKFDV